MPTSILKIERDRPADIRLKWTDGLPVTGQYGPQVQYTLEDGRRFYVDPEISKRIAALEVSPGEPFTICKRSEGRRIVWDIERVKSTGEGPAEAEETQEAVRRPSLEVIPKCQNPITSALLEAHHISVTASDALEREGIAVQFTSHDVTALAIALLERGGKKAA